MIKLIIQKNGEKYLTEPKHTTFNKIFQIGFNKCGTTSIHQFFLNNGLRSVHWDLGNLAKTIQNNHQQNKPLLGDYELYHCYTDMESTSDNIFIYLTHYQELDKQYPNSKFILNVRNVDDWIQSRLKHPNYLQIYKSITGLDKEGVIKHWKEIWNSHIIEVTEYFKDRPQDLVIFDIETEQHKFVDFMSNLIELKDIEFLKMNKTYK